MKKFLSGLALIMLCSALTVIAQENNYDQIEPNYGITDSNANTEANSKEDKEAYKKELKANNKLIDNIHDIRKMREQKRIRNRNLEFYNKRLNISKNRLEELQEKKGDGK